MPTYAYNDPIFTRTNIAIPDYTGYGLTTDVYNINTDSVEFDFTGPADITFYTYGGFAALLLDGIDQAFVVGPSTPSAGTLKLTVYSLAAGLHTILLTGSGTEGGANFAFAGMDIDGGGGQAARAYGFATT